MERYYAISLILLTSFSFGQSFTAMYDFASIPSKATNGLTDPTSPPVIYGLIFSSFKAQNSNTNLNSGAAGRFSYKNQSLGGIANSNTYTDHKGILDPNSYFTFTISPASGTSFELSKITFKSQRSGTGIRTYAIRSSTDGFTSNLTASVSPVNAEITVQTGNIFYRVNDAKTNAQSGNTITLSGPDFTGITSPITFRIYGWNAETTGGTFSVDDVVITGSIAITTLGVNQNEITGLSIYPNPVNKGILYITSNSNTEKSITIFDVLGKQVLNTNTSNNSVNVLSLKGGSYIVKITEDGKTGTKKIIIE
ncbi:MAG: T9SS type A sorting domain-containing protein [Bacteroidota bacterium]